MKLYIKCVSCSKDNTLKNFSFKDYKTNGFLSLNETIPCIKCKNELELKSQYLKYSDSYLVLFMFIITILLIAFLIYKLAFNSSMSDYNIIPLITGFYAIIILTLLRIRDINKANFNTIKYYRMNKEK